MRQHTSHDDQNSSSSSNGAQHVTRQTRPPTSHDDSLVSRTRPPWPPKPPTSHYDSLVCFSHPPWPLLTNTTTNESQWLVGESHLSSLTTKTTNESLWLVGVFFSSSPALSTPQPPTSHDDSLVCFSSSNTPLCELLLMGGVILFPVVVVYRYF